jgi:hypothetical protein
MGRQIRLHLLPEDVNELIVAMHDKEPLELAMQHGNSEKPKRLVFISESMSGKTLVLWSERLAPKLHCDYVAKAQPPFYFVNEQTEAVLQLSLSALTMWNGRPALTQGRIYGVFENKQRDFEKCYERIARYVKRRWRRNPAEWMGGHIGPAAGDCFDGGGLLLPNYIPPISSDWIQRLTEQHPGQC